LDEGRSSCPGVLQKVRSPYPRTPSELLDARAKDAYRRRLAEIDEDIAEAPAIEGRRRPLKRRDAEAHEA
jgi:hypothetical protein